MRVKALVLTVLGVGVVCGQVVPGGAQDRRGRKYKAPPPTSHIEVLVTKEGSDKPISNAAVIFRATRDGKDDGNLELKTDPDGKAALDVIQTGSNVRVQVIAKGYATFAEEYQVDEASREIHVELVRPREQVSAYADNTGKASTRTWGVQEPVKQVAQPPAGEGTLQKRAPADAAAADGKNGSQATKPTDQSAPAKDDSAQPKP